jgi:hypothetical protein
MLKKILDWLTHPQLISKIFRKITKLFFFEQWILLVAKKSQHNGRNWQSFKPLMPPRGRFWADPFFWQKDDTTYIFYEELFLSDYRGYISCITLDKKLHIKSNIPVLKRPYHLSYPFIFEYEDQLYMLPETKESGQIELYRCEHFPDQWELDRVLIENILAVDTTLLNHAGKWWLFTNVEEEGGSSWDALHLFYADSPLSTEWRKHPKNPIIENLQNARPAGRIFMQNGQLIRPAQNCSVRYGYAINFNRITKLSENDYEETREASFKPKKFSKYYATHTWNELGNLRVIDALQWRSKFF